MFELNEKEINELLQFKKSYLELIDKTNLNHLPEQSLIDSNMELAAKLFDNYLLTTDSEDYYVKAIYYGKAINRYEVGKHKEVFKSHINKEEFWLSVNLKITDISDIKKAIPEANQFLNSLEFKNKYINNSKDLMAVEVLLGLEKEDVEEFRSKLKEYVKTNDDIFETYTSYGMSNVTEEVMNILLDEKDIDKELKVNFLLKNPVFLNIVNKKDNDILNDSSVVENIIGKGKILEYIENFNEENQKKAINTLDLNYISCKLIKTLEPSVINALSDKLLEKHYYDSSKIILFLLENKNNREKAMQKISENNAKIYFKQVINMQEDDLKNINHFLEKNDNFLKNKYQYLENWIDNLKISKNDHTKVIKEINKYKDLKEKLHQNPINKYNTMLKTNKRDFTINTLKEIYKLINETNDIEKEKQIITAFENVSIELKKELKIKKEGIYKFISYEVLRDELETKEEKKSKNKL